MSYLNEHQALKLFIGLSKALSVRSEDSTVSVVKVVILTLNSRRGALVNTFLGDTLEWCENVSCSLNGVGWRNNIGVGVASICPWI